MANFQNGLTSGIFSVFLSGFLPLIPQSRIRTDDRWRTRQEEDRLYQNRSTSLGCHHIFFAQSNCKWFVEWSLTCSLELQFLTQSKDFAKPITFAGWSISKWSHLSNLYRFLERFFSLHRTMANFQNGLTPGIFSVFLSGFLPLIPQSRIRTDDRWRTRQEEDRLYQSRSTSLGCDHIFFAQNNCKWFVEWILTCFLEF